VTGTDDAEAMESDIMNDKGMTKRNDRRGWGVRQLTDSTYPNELLEPPDISCELGAIFPHPLSPTFIAPPSLVHRGHGKVQAVGPTLQVIAHACGGAEVNQVLRGCSSA
jgi:hypothetical protein